MKKFEADSFVKKEPLSINNDELVFITKQVKESETKKIIAAYNKHSPVKFGSLPPQAQTVIASVAYQYGSHGVIVRTPKFWNQAINQDWSGMYKNLMDFDDGTPSRREKEAERIKELIK